MKTNTKQVLTALTVVAWIVYIGLCIRTGNILVSCLITLFGDPAIANSLNQDVDLSKLHSANVQYYVEFVSLLVGLYGIKAHIFYMLIKVLSKLNIDYPFSPSMASLIERISQLTLGAGVVALIANGHNDWLMKRDLIDRMDWGTAELLLMAGVIFVIAMVFKRGTEIQAENDLTI